MGNVKKMEVAVLNIVTHPHSPEGYASLMLDAFALKHPTKYLGTEQFILNKPVPINRDEPLEGFSGFLHKFTEIDLRAAWMDLEKLEAVESEDGEPVVNIPEAMKPNCKTAPYVFLPKGHRFFFPTAHTENNEKITFSPARVAKALANLFAHESIREKYGEVTVTVESSEQSIEEILSIPALTKLIVDVTLPNPDDNDGDEAEALRRMQEQHARKVHTAWTGTKDDGIKPDADTRGFMKLSLSNGYVKAEGYDAERQKVTKKTSEHPVKLRGAYSKGKSALSCLVAVAQENIGKFTARAAQVAKEAKRR
ncbi:DUF4747 family protein [Pseudodesulfovibrio pelocollis]|uniref:DUF4747 family protein n=1 Tax=Pseudodesulfovibrio pelocollis TaxID=3051432 RepID=UPI00255AC56B|nr:DUF4747 family protein [Pseudodesulfovibrio sp. SB368]